MYVAALILFGVCTSVGLGARLPQQDGVLPYMVIGDWGGMSIQPFTTADEVACAKQMGLIGANINSSFVLALGDNFYEFGITTDVHDRRFKETFEDVFTAQSLQTPWHIIAGNHDHFGNVTAEVAYSQLSKRWDFPSLYYSFNHTLLGTKTTVGFIMIDTVILAGILGITPGQIKSLPVNKYAAEEQWDWIEKQLEATKRFDYVIVAGHYPVWSIAEHGPNQILVSRLRPLLIKYNVNAYFCGHDHNLQHIREVNSTVDYFVIGAGHVVDKSRAHVNDIPKGSLKFSYAEPGGKGGFAYLATTPKSMPLIFADGIAGKDLYMADIQPRVKPSQ